jgi:hypothetical protein
MTPALPHPINDRSPGLKKMVRKWMLSRDEAPCVQHMCTIGADCGMECACNACRDHVIQVGSLRESQTVCERRGVVRRGVPNRRLSVRTPKLNVRTPTRLDWRLSTTCSTGRLHTAQRALDHCGRVCRSPRCRTGRCRLVHTVQETTPLVRSLRGLGGQASEGRC